MKTLHVMNGTRKEKSPDPAVRLQQVIEEYGKLRPLYQDYAEVVRFILQEELHAKSIRVHSIEVRAKSIESFRRKITRAREAESGEIPVLDPLTEITDTQTAQHLIDTINAVRLLGAQIILTGIRPAIAQSMVQLGLDLSGVVTKSTLAAGIQHAMQLQNRA